MFSCFFSSLTSIFHNTKKLKTRKTSTKIVKMPWLPVIPKFLSTFLTFPTSKPGKDFSKKMPLSSLRKGFTFIMNGSKMNFYPPSQQKISMI